MKENVLINVQMDYSKMEQHVFHDVIQIFTRKLVIILSVLVNAHQQETYI